MKFILGQYSGVVQLFKNISSQSHPQQNTTRPRIACTASHAVAVKYTTKQDMLPTKSKAGGTLKSSKSK